MLDDGRYGKCSLTGLTQRERQVAQLIAIGAANHQIADRLSISMKTVEKHRANAYKKLKVRSTGALAIRALQHNLLTLEQAIQFLDAISKK